LDFDSLGSSLGKPLLSSGDGPGLAPSSLLRPLTLFEAVYTEDFYTVNVLVMAHRVLRKVGDRIVFEDGLDNSQPSAHDAPRRVTYFTSRAAQAGRLHCSHGH
jgi:hypothetical protein